MTIPVAAVSRAAECVARLWQRHGLEPDEWAGLYRGPYVDICPPALQNELPPAGTVIQPLRHTDAHRAGTTDPPRVYVTLGTIFNRRETFVTLLDAFAAVDCSITMTVGRNLDPATLGPLPKNATVTRYVPQAEILASASAAVVHGGSGSTFAALAHGRPLLMLPQGADQFDNARAVTTVGAGITLFPPDRSTERLQSSLTTLLGTSSYAGAAAAIAGEIATMPTADEAAATLFSSERR